MAATDLPRFNVLVQKFKGVHAEMVPSDERMVMVGLSFSYIEPRHRFGILTKDLREKIVDARRRLHASLPDDMARLVERFDPHRFTASASLLDNALFGRIAHQMAEASDRISAITKELLHKFDIYDDTLSIGLQFDVGAGGKRLTIEQRQKLNLARILLKRSDYLILNRPLSALDQRVQDQITSHIIQERARQEHRASILWVLSNPRLATLFDRVLVFHRGTLAGVGSYAELSRTNAIFRELIS